MHLRIGVSRTDKDRNSDAQASLEAFLDKPNQRASFRHDATTAQIPQKRARHKWRDYRWRGVVGQHFAAGRGAMGAPDTGRCPPHPPASASEAPTPPNG